MDDVHPLTNSGRVCVLPQNHQPQLPTHWDHSLRDWHARRPGSSVSDPPSTRRQVCLIEAALIHGDRAVWGNADSCAIPA
jgi:hypothetical protein